MLENKKTAILFSICAILLSTFFSAKMEFGGMQKQLDALYYEEVGMHSDLMALAGSAYNIDKIAQRYDLPTGSLTSTADRLQNSTPDTAGDLAMELADVFQDICDKLMNADLSAKDQELLIKQQADFKSTQDIISRSAYHDLALSIENDCAKFPANWLQKMTMSELEIYKEVQ